MQTLPDCSFTQAGKGRSGFGQGAAAVDLGSQRIAQKVAFGEHSCVYFESLIVTDCNRRELIVLEGLPSDSCCYGEASAVRLFLPPSGPIALTSSATVKQLEMSAENNEIEYTRDFRAWLATKRVARKFNPFCGCKLYYPDSPGAKL